MVCEIEFLANGKEYLIRRGQKPNIFEIYEDGKLLNQDSSVYDYQDYLVDRILKINYKSFVQIIVVGSATYVPFMQLLPNYRRAVVEDLLNIDIISKMNIALKRRMAEHSVSMNDVAKKLDITQEKIKIHNEYVTTNLEVVEDRIRELTQELQDNEEKRCAKAIEIKTIADEIAVLRGKKERGEKAYLALTELEKISNNVKHKIKTISSSKIFFEKHSICPKCLQGITDEHKEKIFKSKDNELQKLQETLQEIEQQIETIKPKIDAYHTACSLLQEKESEKMKMMIEQDSIARYVKKLEHDLNEAKKKKEEMTKTLNENLSEMMEQMKTLTSDKNTLLYQSQIYDTAVSMLKDDGIKTKIIKYYLPTMNKLINKYLGLMSFNIGFELNENFEETIHNAAKRDFTYENFSEGEKLRIDLAILFAWRDLSKIKTNINTNLLIMDEILDSSLDSEGIDDFIRIIRTVIDDKQNNVFIITHKDEQIADKFHRAIKFEKPDGRFTKAVELIT